MRATAASTVKLFISMVSAVSVAEGRLVTVPCVTCFSCQGFDMESAAKKDSPFK